MLIFDREDNSNYTGIAVFGTFERMRHWVNTLDKEITDKWTFQHTQNRFTLPSGARVMVATIRNMGDCYKLAGLEFQHLMFCDHIASPMVDYLKSRVRSAHTDIPVEVEHCNYGN